MTTTTLENKEKFHQFVWTGFILMFFVVQGIVWTVAISITSRDTSHSVVAGYDEDALKWDEAQAERRASESLGWQAGVNVAQTGDIKGNRQLSLKLTDKDGNAIEGADVKFQAFHRGRSAEVQKLTMNETTGGIYETTLRVRNGGTWQFNGSATLGENQFLIEEYQDITVKRNP